MKESNNTQSPNKPSYLRRGLALGTAAGTLLLPAACTVNGEKAEPVTPSTATTEITSTTALTEGPRPSEALDPALEAAKQKVGDSLIATFKKAYSGDVNGNPEGALSIERKPGEPSYEGSKRNNYEVVVTVDGKKVKMWMTAPGEATSPRYDGASVVSVSIVEPGKGTPNSDNPNGDLYEGEVTWEKVYIEGQEGRVDVQGSDNAGAPFSSQNGDFGAASPGVIGGMEAAQAASGVVDLANNLLGIQ